MRLIRGLLQEQTGSSLTLLAVAMPLLMGVLGLVVDTGMYGLSLVRLSSAADSAALAAVSAVDFAHYASTGLVRLEPGRAQSKAEAYAVANYDSTVQTTVTIAPSNPGRAQVRLRATYNTIFLRIFGVDQATLEAHAEAQVG